MRDIYPELILGCYGNDLPISKLDWFDKSKIKTKKDLELFLLNEENKSKAEKQEQTWILLGLSVIHTERDEIYPSNWVIGFEMQSDTILNLYNSEEVKSEIAKFTELFGIEPKLIGAAWDS